ncbi:hypothetical protein BGZ83_002557, partial [Gryganskiella cystojenkinii]
AVLLEKPRERDYESPEDGDGDKDREDDDEDGDEDGDGGGLSRIIQVRERIQKGLCWEHPIVPAKIGSLNRNVHITGEDEETASTVLECIRGAGKSNIALKRHAETVLP